MRVFIAVNLPAKAKKELNELQRDLKKKHWPVKWEKPKKIHITLAFLDNLKYQNSNVKSTSQILNLLEKAVREGIEGIEPFEISFKGIGSFPDFVQPRVVWVGLKGDLKSLITLKKGIEKELKKATIWFDKKPFVPHITIGRVKKGISQGALRDLGKKISKLRQIDFQSRILVDLVEIMKSELLAEGSVYEKLVEVRL